MKSTRERYSKSIQFVTLQGKKVPRLTEEFLIKQKAVSCVPNNPSLQAIFFQEMLLQTKVLGAGMLGLLSDDALLTMLEEFFLKAS